MSFESGALVRARGREWVVLPDSESDLLVLRPLGGTDDEVTGILPELEPVEPACFDPPSPDRLGDHDSCRRLRDAVRLSFRQGSGPFRSFGRIAIEPRPYQLVPLLMAMRLNPVRILIADDVGIGKTVEASLIARELLDRGEVSRMAVLCPPHLAEQWQFELSRFHIEAEPVLPGTAARLERHCRLDESLFDHYPFTIVSLDFIKSERRRQEFLAHCPELVLIDEAHTCAPGGDPRGRRHQRHQLAAGLGQDPQRHLILLTATPHSGNEDAFRSLLGLLDPELKELPEDLAGRQNEPHRRRLARHLVQRRRADIRLYLDADTPFPRRLDKEETYRLSPAYRELFQAALRYARETTTAEGLARPQQRIRWWSALALLRSLASSPAAAAATMRSRARTVEAETPEEIDEIGRRAVMDLTDDESAEGDDVIPGSDPQEEDDSGTAPRRRLLEMARRAEALEGDGDPKLAALLPHLQELLDAGYHPIVFCRFIPTAEYLAAELRRRLPGDVEISAVTGLLAPADREQRVAELAKADRRLLVCTDCLSEGINLQESFNAVVHYDLSWNPTRHEQREGRVDRFGQPSDNVRVLTYYGIDNGIDGIVLDVLLRKHKAIRNRLGISVPVPVDSQSLLEALYEGLLLRGRDSPEQLTLFEELQPLADDVHREWEDAAERERRSRTLFAQHSIRVDEVAEILREVRAAIGTGVDVQTFTIGALQRAGARIRQRNGTHEIDLSETPAALRDLLGVSGTLRVRFDLPLGEGEILLTRTHPIVEALASYVLDTALDPQCVDGIARRAGVMRTCA
ncbi:MAG: ATP-dependent helicase, partial [Bacteroidetes bacterium]